MKIDILTLFPEMFAATKSSILGRAEERKLLEINLVNIRDFTLDKHNRVDDYPFGGGEGMVMSCEPIYRTLNSVNARRKKIIYMSPKGDVLSQKKIQSLSKLEEIVVLCGHYEGIDERILEGWDIEEISIGDYILTGGEPGAIVLVDAVARLIPGVIGNDDSVLKESIYSGLLEHPYYTKPREYDGKSVPEVLVSGDHKKIHLWKFEKSLMLTKNRRPEMFEEFCNNTQDLTKEEKIVLEKVKNLL